MAATRSVLQGLREGRELQIVAGRELLPFSELYSVVGFDQAYEWERTARSQLSQSINPSITRS